MAFYDDHWDRDRDQFRDDFDRSPHGCEADLAHGRHLAWQMRNGQRNGFLPEGANVERAQRMFQALTHDDSGQTRGEQCLRMVATDAAIVRERERLEREARELERERGTLDRAQRQWQTSLREHRASLATMQQAEAAAKTNVEQLTARVARRTQAIGALDRRIHEAKRTLAAIERSTAEALAREQQEPPQNAAPPDGAVIAPAIVAAAAPALAPSAAAISNDDCAVCCTTLDAPQNAVLHSADEVVTTACKHRIHRTCLAQWMLKQNSCVLCRSKLF
jgi:hypothetical protein